MVSLLRFVPAIGILISSSTFLRSTIGLDLSTRSMRQLLRTSRMLPIVDPKRFSQRLASTTPTSESPPVIPRAAVSVCVRCSPLSTQDNDTFSNPNCNYYYLLVQRGKSPNKGMWSLPGGKLEYGETTLAGAMRELAEETTGWENNGGVTTSKTTTTAVQQSPVHYPMRWYNGSVTTTDAIGEGYHYVIAHAFMEIGNVAQLPHIIAQDDAADAKWFERSAIQELELHGGATKGVDRVIQRIEELSAAGLLPTQPM